jgi:two-component system OmpR family sensor kinase
MSHPMTLPIRTRLALVCATLVGAIVVGLGTLVYLRLEADLRASADDQLASRAEELADEPPDGPTIDPGPSDVGDVFAQILARDGAIVATTPGLLPSSVVPASDLASLDGPRSFEMTVATTDEPVLARVLAVPSTDGGVIVTGVAFDDQREVLDRLRVLFALAGAVAVVLAGAVGWLVARAALRPVDRMRVESEAVSASEPGRRLPVSATRDELAALGRSLNRMLDRLEAAVERERRFVADAGHELRTPLANLKAELDLALRRARSPSELVDALRSASEETDRLARLAEDLLLLATAEGGRLPMRLEEVEVAGLVRATVDSFSGRAATLGIALATQDDEGLRARLDGTRIRQAVGNLVDNALRHTPAGGTVTVTTSRAGRTVSIAVADTGEGFSGAFLPHAFDAFARADASRSRSAGGAGLGLAIVRAIVEAHGGTVEARNRDDGGAIVALHLPA